MTLDPPLHDAFLGSGIKTPQATITTQADRTLWYDFVAVNAHRTLLNVLLTTRNYRCFSHAGQTCCADMEEKACCHTYCHKPPDQGAVTDRYIE